MYRWLLVTLLAFGIMCHVDAAPLRLNRQFSDGMVLQQGKPTVLRGNASPGANVAVAFAGQQHATQADVDGYWSVALVPMPANTKGQSLTVTDGRQTVVLKDVLIGDVFLVALQTSVDISLGGTPDGIAAAKDHRANPLYRTISIQTLPAAHPQHDLAEEATAGWQVVRPASALQMSAIAYYLGTSLAAEMDVPIGVIDVNLGSAFPISWLSHSALLETEQLYGNSTVNRMLRRFDNLVALLEKGESFLERSSG